MTIRILAIRIENKWNSSNAIEHSVFPCDSANLVDPSEIAVYAKLLLAERQSGASRSERRSISETKVRGRRMR